MSKVNYEAVAKDIKAILDRPGYDDGSIGPVLVRLAWHASGTFCRHSMNGGSNGATMRFKPEAQDGANAGLEHARQFLEPIKAKHPNITYADLWTLSGCVAIEAMGGPQIKWNPGRSDAPDERYCPPQGRLPDGAKGQDHVRDVFYRMGFNDREIVALLGCHSIGRAHRDRSGFDGPWTFTPTRFSNQFFKLLSSVEWKPKQWDGPMQFTDPSGELMMLPADLALIKDAEFKKYVDIYAQDKAVFFKDFSAAFAKLLELGVVRKESRL